MLLSIALMSGAAVADPELVARADELNSRYVECLFATFRDAREQALPESRFPARLAASCNDERAQLHRVFVRVRVQRGSTSAQAETEWLSLEAQGRASVERAYRIGGALPD